MKEPCCRCGDDTLPTYRIDAADWRDELAYLCGNCLREIEEEWRDRKTFGQMNAARKARQKEVFRSNVDKQTSYVSLEGIAPEDRKNRV